MYCTCSFRTLNGFVARRKSANYVVLSLFVCNVGALPRDVGLGEIHTLLEERETVAVHHSLSYLIVVGYVKMATH